MALIPIDDLIRPLTVDECRTAIYSTLAATGVTTTAWKPGAVVRTMIAAVALVASALSTLIAGIARAGFLDLSSGSWLTLLAFYVYGVSRIDATFAAGTLAYTNSGGGIYGPFTAGNLVIANARTGKKYVNTASVTIAALSSGTFAVRAVEAGSASTALPGEAVVQVSPSSGVTITQPQALIGADAEEDQALIARCRARLGALSPNGPRDAYTFIAKSATRSDGTTIGVTRVSVIPDGAGNVTVYVATATGAVVGDPDDDTTDLGAVAESIQLQCVPLGITANVFSAGEIVIPITYSAWIYNTTGFTATEIVDAVTSSLADFFSARPIGGDQDGGGGGNIFTSGIAAAIAETTINGIKLPLFKVEISAPATAATALSAGQVAVLGTVTPNFVFRAPPAGV